MQLLIELVQYIKRQKIKYPLYALLSHEIIMIVLIYMYNRVRVSSVLIDYHSSLFGCKPCFKVTLTPVCKFLMTSQ